MYRVKYILKLCNLSNTVLLLLGVAYFWLSTQCDIVMPWHREFYSVYPIAALLFLGICLITTIVSVAGRKADKEKGFINISSSLLSLGYAGFLFAFAFFLQALNNPQMSLPWPLLGNEWVIYKTYAFVMISVFLAGIIIRILSRFAHDAVKDAGNAKKVPCLK